MTTTSLSKKVLLQAFRLMATAKNLTEIYEENFKEVSKYVHATSRGHEATQLAAALHLRPQDYAFPYYRDDAMLLGIGMEPYQLMLQLLAKRDDPFSGGRTYYSHPSLRDADKPKIPHQSSATGMQAIPATGAALGFWYKEQTGLVDYAEKDAPVVLCSLGDASVTEGEVAEAFQMAALKRLPILYLVQDNGWDISANAAETRAQNAVEYAKGFAGLETRDLDGSNFVQLYEELATVIETIRRERRPFLVRANVPLLNHHTSGVRKEWYRDDLEEHQGRDPYPRLRAVLLDHDEIELAEIETIERETREHVQRDLDRARAAADPTPEDLFTHVFAPTPIATETGDRTPADGEKKVMVDCALFAVEELMREHPECLLYGQDVGGRLGGVFREAATLAQKFGDERVFNTPIQEAFIIGSTVGMSAVGLKPIVEVQFADYLWPGMNQLFTEVSRSCYLSNGKYPVSCIIRVPIGAYGSGGPYHSSSIESAVANIRGLKIAYPSNGADLKGLLKSAYDDPNPVLIFEHKGLYWSKVPGTQAASTIEPAADYRVPFGVARRVQSASKEQIEDGNSAVIITYGMGVHWALNASKNWPDHIEILDLRTLHPLDKDAVFAAARQHGRVLLITEESIDHSLVRALAGEIQEECFTHLDAPVMTIGSENVPAIPLNSTLEQTMIPNAEKVAARMEMLLAY